MSEAFKRGALPYYESRGATVRPGDYIAGELATEDGFVTVFSGHVCSIITWSDGTYLHLTDQTIRIPNRMSSSLSLRMHHRRGVLPV